MSSFYESVKKHKDLDYIIFHLDDHFGHRKYGFRAVLHEHGVPIWNGDTWRNRQEAFAELKKKIKMDGYISVKELE